MKFLSLTEHATKKPLFINFDQVIYFEGKGSGGTVILLPYDGSESQNWIDVEESPEEIAFALEFFAGSIYHKKAGAAAR